MNILEKFPDIRIAIFGDFFLDRYLLIDPALDEPSVETSLTAYQVIGRRQAPGAAGTVAKNLRALGVGSVLAAGMTGLDGEGFELREELRKIGVDMEHLLVVPERITPTYVKPMRLEHKGETELNRLDIKNRKPTPDWVIEHLEKQLEAFCDSLDAIMILDQVSENGTGIITERMRNFLKKLGSENRKAILFADSRTKIGEFSNVIVKCNHYEAVGRFYPEYDRVNGIAKEEPEDARIIDCALKMAEETARAVFVTLGARGMFVVDRGKCTHVPGIEVEGPIDICGAGDAASSGIVAALCAGASLEEAAYLGNIAASITIRQLGTTGTATPEQIRLSGKREKEII